MGYTLTVPCADEASKASMMGFLKAEYRDWPSLTKRASHVSCLRGPIDSDFSYDDGTCRLGFDIGPASHFEREYGFTVCRWASMQVGEVRVFPTQKYPSLVGSFPVIVYDGEDEEHGSDCGAMPVVMEGKLTSPSMTWTVVDKLGMRARKASVQDWIENVCSRFNGADVIRAEMARLDAAWRNRWPSSTRT